MRFITKDTPYMPPLEGDVPPEELPLGGDPAVSDSVHLRANLVFAIISQAPA